LHLVQKPAARQNLSCCQKGSPCRSERQSRSAAPHPWPMH